MLSYISVYSALLPIFVFLLFVRSKRPKEQLWVIFVYIILSLLSDLALIYFTHDDDARFQITIFTIVEGILFSLYLILIARSATIKKTIGSASIIFTCFSLIYVYILLGKEEYYRTIASIETILVIVSCILLFFEQLSSPQSLFIYSTSSFWIIVSILFYLAGTFFLSLVLPELSAHERDMYWPLFLVFNILKNVLFAVAFSLKNTSSDNSLFPKNQNI